MSRPEWEDGWLCRAETGHLASGVVHFYGSDVGMPELENGRWTWPRGQTLCWSVRKFRSIYGPKCCPRMGEIIGVRIWL